MDPINLGLSLAAAGAAALAIRANYHGPPWHIFIFKPLATALILALAARLPAPELASGRTALLAGLVGALAGDIALMFPGERWFSAGLVCFLLTQIAYSSAFAPALRWGPWTAVRAAGLGLALAGAYWGLRPGLGSLRAPVLVYLTALGVMAWLAVERAAALGTAPAGAAALGALLFAASDSTLAYERFRRPFPAARLVVLGTYWAAQWLIALAAA